MATTFGTVFTPTMPVAEFSGDAYGSPRLQPTESLSLHPAAHVLHYGSACFEGLKAHRGVDGVVRTFRADRHVARMRGSAERLSLPAPPTELLAGMIVTAVRAHLDTVPDAPGALYIRPTLIGTEPNIGAAASPSAQGLLYVLTSPVGEYFAGGSEGLRIAVETGIPRTTPQFGEVKAGANYAMALGPTLRAQREQGAAQVLFATGGTISETGASNFLLLDEDRIITPEPNGAFLHGVTRLSVLELAGDRGWKVEERDVSVEELREWVAAGGECALSGTAAVLAGVGTLVFGDEEVAVTDGQVGPVTTRLREALRDIQLAKAPDEHGWLTEITC